MSEFLQEAEAEALPASDATRDDPPEAKPGPQLPGRVVELTGAELLLIATVERDLARQRAETLNEIIASRGYDLGGAQVFQFEDGPKGRLVLRVIDP